MASNFANAIKAAIDVFEEETGHRVILIFGSTGKHFAQIRNGAPFEAFFAADARRPELLEAQGVAQPGSRFTYAVGKVVLWSPDPDLIGAGADVLMEGRFWPGGEVDAHSFVESPDMMNIYNGNITTGANGHAVVHLPEWFEALNRDFRYQLTVIGSFARAMVAKKVRDNRFVIRTSEPGVEVSWQVPASATTPTPELIRSKSNSSSRPMRGAAINSPNTRTGWIDPTRRSLPVQRVAQFACGSIANTSIWAAWLDPFHQPPA